MASVKDIHQLEDNIGGFVLFIEGCPLAFADIEALVGSGSGSWIGTSYGAREILPGLEVPDLPLGETVPFDAAISEARVSFSIRDFDGRVAELFADEYPDASTDSMHARLAPWHDPAPETIPGPAQTPVGLWGRHVGTEAIGPAGERRHYWIEPSGAPPGLDHLAGDGWPPIVITDEPRVWVGRMVAVYRIVQDPDTGEWPSWTDQHAGGSLWWIGRLKGRGTYAAGGQGRTFHLPANGVSSLLRKSINLARPTVWYKPTGGISLSGDAAKVAAWIGVLGGVQVEDGIVPVPSTYDCQTLISGNTLEGLPTREAIVAKLRDIVATMISGVDHGSVLASTNAEYSGPIPPVANDEWQVGNAARDVAISPDGSVIKIKCEHAGDGTGFDVGLALDGRVWQLLGWHVLAPNFSSAKDLSGLCPVGGVLWGENNEDAQLPPMHYVARFDTRPSADAPSWQWDNGGKWRDHIAPYQVGTVTLTPEGGDELRLGFDPVIAEGQFGQPFTLGGQIDGTDVDTTGWWLFRGKRLTAEAELAGDDPEDFAQIALCEWVTTDTGDAVEVDDAGLARLRVIRWEDPRRFGLPYDRMAEPWTSVAGGLECAPLAVLGGIHPEGAPDWRHRLIPRLLLSSGMAAWDDSGSEVVLVPGTNHPADAPAADPWMGDVEVADLGLGLPRAWVDWASWYSCANKLPGGAAGALNRVTYAVFGPAQAEDVLGQAMRGAGWAWAWKRAGGEGPLRLGCWDPLDQLQPADVEVTLSRALAAEPNSPATARDAQWTAVVELRNDGPYDRFEFHADRDPLEGGLQYSSTFESLDPGRRYRDGMIAWSIEDGGLRDPTHWLGDPLLELHSWLGQARERFAAAAGNYYARPGRVWRQVLDASLITRIGLGTVVHVIDPVAEAPDGEIGINHLGRVVEATIINRGGQQAISVSVLLQRRVVDVKVWGPSAVAGVGSWDADTSTLTIEADHAGVGGGHSDALGFVQPAWDTHDPGSLRVAIYQSHDGVEYPADLEVRADCVSADAQAHTLSLANVDGDLLRDTIKVIVAAPYDEQTSAWVIALYAPVTKPDGTFDGEKGYRL